MNQFFKNILKLSFGVVLICVLVISCKSSSFSAQSKKAQPASTATPPPIVPPGYPTSPPNYPTSVPYPTPPGAVTQGSFTVWAVPPNPARGQDYLIYIAVRLPSGVPNYSLNDLTGRVQGTDGWIQSIQESYQTGNPFPVPAQFQWNGMQAQVTLSVPGAESKVRDDIYITSALLRESQTISLTFQ